MRTSRALLFVLVLSGVARAEPSESHVEALAFHGASVGTSGRPLDGVDRCTVSAASVGMATRVALGDYGPESGRGGFGLTLDGALRRDALLGVQGACGDVYAEAAVLGGGALSVGHAWRRFGLEVGVGALTGSEELVGVFPLLRFVLRSRDVAVTWGIGSERPAHALGPGLFVNLATDRHDLVSFELESGVYLGGPAMAQSFVLATELVMGVRIARDLEVRPGFGLSAPDVLGVPGYQSTLGLRWELER